MSWRDCYFTEGMRWFIIIAIACFVFAVFFAFCVSKTPPGKSDFEEARLMCGNRGVAHFSYRYINDDGDDDETQVPDVTCNK